MSSKREKLLNFYTDVLATARHNVKDDGSVVFMVGKDEVPATVNFRVPEHEQVPGEPTVITRNMVSVMEELLRNPRDTDVFFHPTSEQMTRGESEVFRYLKRAILLRLNTSVTQLGAALLGVQQDASLQHKMTMEQLDIIKDIADSDKSSVMAWTKLCVRPIKENPLKPSTWGLNIHIKRNGTYGGKPYRRVGIVTMPMFEEVLSGKQYESADGKNLFRVKDYSMFRQVIRTIFPEAGVRDSETLNTGYDGTFAPYFVCFMKTVKSVADRLNYVVRTMEPAMKEVGIDTSSLLVETPWFDYVSDEGLDILSDISRSVPALIGNIGAVPVGSEEPKEEEDEPSAPVRREERRPEPLPQKQQEPTPKPEPAKVVKEEDDGLNAEQRRLRDEAMERRKRFEEERKMIEEEERRDRERRERDRDDRRNDRRDDYRDRDDRRDGRRDDRRDPPWEDEPIVKDNGKVSFGALLGANPDIARGTLTEEEERDSRGRGRGRGRSRYDDRDDRYDYRRDRYDDRRSRYDDCDDRYDRYDRDYDRRGRRGSGLYDDYDRGRSYRR